MVAELVERHGKKRSGIYQRSVRMHCESNRSGKHNTVELDLLHAVVALKDWCRATVNIERAALF